MEGGHTEKNTVSCTAKDFVKLISSLNDSQKTGGSIYNSFHGTMVSGMVTSLTTHSEG